MDRKKARGHTHTHTHTRPLIILSLSFHSKAASQTDNSFEMYSSAEEKWFHYVSFIALPDLSLCPWRIASRYWTVIGSKPKRESNKKTKKQPCFVGHFCWQQLCRPLCSRQMRTARQTQCSSAYLAQSHHWRLIYPVSSKCNRRIMIWLGYLIFCSIGGPHFL